VFFFRGRMSCWGDEKVSSSGVGGGGEKVRKIHPIMRGDFFVFIKHFVMNNFFFSLFN
jgi:hypothetical protein